MKKSKPSAVEVAARAIFAKCYYVFRHDTILRCKNRADMVVALQELKQEMADKVKATKAPGWEEIIKAAQAKCDAVIKVLVSDQPLDVRKKALEPPKKPSRIILLPERRIKPPEVN